MEEAGAVILVFVAIAAFFAAAMLVACVYDHLARKRAVANGRGHEFVTPSNPLDPMVRCRKCGGAWSAINPNEFLSVPIECGGGQ